MSQPPALPSKAAASSRASSTSGSVNTPTQSSTQQFFSNDSGSRRGAGGSSGGNARSPAPRSTQASKPKHKSGKKFKALDEDASAELYSMQNPHGRKGQTSITHLMNFSLPPRPQQQGQYHRHSYNGPRRGGNNRSWGLGSGYHAVDKARYIHANYRFIVDPRPDYRVQAEDADVHLDWNNVLQIIASATTQEASCPICLSEPTAPRMAKCGHIFCTSCLIRYMHSEDANNPPPEKRARWKKCPICWDSIYISETRPVRWYVGQEGEPPREGHDVVLRLVKRRPGQTLAMPRESAETVPKGENIPWYFAAEVMDYARVMKGGEDYMIEQYNEALQAIEMQQKEDELMFGEDAEWTGRAVRMLKEAKDKVKGIGNPPEQPKKPEQKPERPPIQFNDDDEGVPEMYLQKHAEDSSASSVPNGSSNEQEGHEQNANNTDTTPRTLHEMRHRQTEKPQPAEYFFYQGLLHYYLSPLDIRILKAAFGNYTAFPSSILPRIERVSSGHVVDDDLRKRMKYLAHLPYGCEVGFLECDWTDLVSPQVLAPFKPMLERRRKRHDEKDAREEKDRIRIEKAEERELAQIRRKRPSIPHDFFSSEQLPALGSPPTDQSLPGEQAASPPWPQRSTTGFASLASPSTSPNMQRTVWGTAAVASTEADHEQLPTDEDFRFAHGQDDGWLQGWEKDLLDQRGQLAIGVEGVSLEEGGKGKGAAAGAGGGGGGGGGKKGKKGKKITLMSTATARRGA